jgi:MoxR-like ATPase
LRDSQLGDAHVSDIGNYIKRGKLWEAFTSEKRPVLLIDEIDKADAEFEAFLLELLSDFQVTVPEIGTFKARQIPLVVLTSNNAREMSDALKRRCLHLYIDFPERDQELAIIKLKAPEAADKLAAEVVNVVQSLRKLDLKKSPGISETIDWVKALTLLNVQNLDQELVTETLDTIVKYEGDVRKAQEELKEYVRRARARRGGDAGPAGSPPASDKDLLN